MVFISCVIIVFFPLHLLQEQQCLVQPLVEHSELCHQEFGGILFCFVASLKRKYLISKHNSALQIWEEAYMLQDIRGEQIYKLSK